MGGDQVASVVPVLDERGGVVGRQVLVKDWGEIPPEARAAISTDGKGKINLKLVDRRACIMDIARLKGWVTDKPIDTHQLVTLKIER